ncbi:MAG: hypothetical protein LQ348_006719, partial [Seirophora lacunosa]
PAPPALLHLPPLHRAQSPALIRLRREQRLQHRRRVVRSCLLQATAQEILLGEPSHTGVFIPTMAPSSLQKLGLVLLPKLPDLGFRSVDDAYFSHLFRFFHAEESSGGRNVQGAFLLLHPFHVSAVPGGEGVALRYLHGHQGFPQAVEMPTDPVHALGLA